MKTTKEQTAIITVEAVFIADGQIDLAFQTCADHSEIKKILTRFCARGEDFGKLEHVVTLQLTYIFDAAEAINGPEMVLYILEVFDMNLKVASGFLGGIAAAFVFMYGVGAACKLAAARKESNLKKERVIRPGKDEAEKATVPADTKFFHGQTLIKNKSCLFVPIEYWDKDEELVWYDRHRP